MKKFIISLAALAAVSTTVLAEQSSEFQDIRDYGAKPLAVNNDINDVQLLAQENGTTVYYGKYGMTTDLKELQRWDGKNGG